MFNGKELKWRYNDGRLSASYLYCADRDRTLWNAALKTIGGPIIGNLSQQKSIISLSTNIDHLSPQISVIFLHRNLHKQSVSKNGLRWCKISLFKVPTEKTYILDEFILIYVLSLYFELLMGLVGCTSWIYFGDRWTQRRESCLAVTTVLGTPSQKMNKGGGNFHALRPPTHPPRFFCMYLKKKNMFLHLRVNLACKKTS